MRAPRRPGAVYGEEVHLCVGEVEDDPAHRLAKGQKVAAVMGGMGRTRNGSYAEFVTVPASNVVPIETDLDWADFAAIPESYATAWSCLVGNLRIGDGAVLLVRAGTSALGQAAINIATHAGVTVLASTRHESNRDLLTTLGASQVLIETGQLGNAVRQDYPDGIDGVLDLVGNSTLLDSLTMVRRRSELLRELHVGDAPVPGHGDPAARDRRSRRARRVLGEAGQGVLVRAASRGPSSDGGEQRWGQDRRGALACILHDGGRPLHWERRRPAGPASTPGPAKCQRSQALPTRRGDAHTSSRLTAPQHGAFDLIVEATGCAPLVCEAMKVSGKNGLLVPASVTRGDRMAAVIIPAHGA
jgi:threonine dehydrogenase-like Zn-dependent dehydrogenase